MLKVCLEWDETGQAARLQRGLICVDGIMPVLVIWLQCLMFSAAVENSNIMI